MRTDIAGRRRREGQERGLRPLFPRLPDQWVSRAMRVAMLAADWARFDALTTRAAEGTDTGARAAGRALMVLLDTADLARAAHWLDWEHDKARRLLAAAGRAA